MIREQHLTGEELYADEPDTQGVQELHKEIQALASTVRKLTKGNTQQSWAQVAAIAWLIAQVLAKKARKMLVTQALKAGSLSAKTAVEIVADIQSTARGKGEILEARKLLSGAIALTFKSIEAKNQ